MFYVTGNDSHTPNSLWQREREKGYLTSISDELDACCYADPRKGGGGVLRGGKGKERQSRKGGAETDHYGRSGLLLADPWLQHNSKCHRDKRGAL